MDEKDYKVEAEVFSGGQTKNLNSGETRVKGVYLIQFHLLFIDDTKSEISFVFFLEVRVHFEHRVEGFLCVF